MGKHKSSSAPTVVQQEPAPPVVSLAANAGVPLHVVQSIVGHESTAMTRHYYHECVDSLQRAVNAIPTL